MCYASLMNANETLLSVDDFQLLHRTLAANARADALRRALRRRAVAGQRTLRATQPDVSVGEAREQFRRVQRGAA